MSWCLSPFFLFVNPNCAAHARSVYLCFGGRLAIVSTAPTTASSQTHGTGPTCKIDGQADASDTMQAAGGLTHVVAALASRMDADCMELCVLLCGHGVRCGSDKGCGGQGGCKLREPRGRLCRIPADCQPPASETSLFLCCRCQGAFCGGISAIGRPIGDAQPRRGHPKRDSQILERMRRRC